MAPGPIKRANINSAPTTWQAMLTVMASRIKNKIERKRTGRRFAAARVGSIEEKRSGFVIANRITMTMAANNNSKYIKRLRKLLNTYDR